MKGVLIVLIAISLASCNKGDCRKCYTVTYENGVEIKRDFEEKKCLIEGQEFWNTTFNQSVVNGTTMECPQ